MRFFLAILALAGVAVSALALRVHYSTEPEFCSINEVWDCGIVNHSPYAVLGGIPLLGLVPGIQQVPVAAVGIAGYIAIGGLALFRRRRLLLAAVLPALGFSLYLTYLEKYVLMVWCVYCVISFGIVSLTTLSSAGWLWTNRNPKTA